MLIKSSLPKTLVAACLAAIAQVQGAMAQEKEITAEGLYREPTCGYDFRVKKSLSVLLNEEPTGITAHHEKWDMEIYANKKDGNWTLVGKSKDSAARSGQLCHLARSVDKPYQNEKWYALYFK